jgi:hypothetical protein
VGFEASSRNLADLSEMEQVENELPMRVNGALVVKGFLSPEM